MATSGPPAAAPVFRTHQVQPRLALCSPLPTSHINQLLLTSQSTASGLHCMGGILGSLCDSWQMLLLCCSRDSGHPCCTCIILCTAHMLLSACDRLTSLLGPEVLLHLSRRHAYVCLSEMHKLSVSCCRPTGAPDTEAMSLSNRRGDRVCHSRSAHNDIRLALTPHIIYSCARQCLPAHGCMTE